ncbi:flagellar protein FlaG [Pseudomonas silesiensis]|uniref:flagellar protein FlaG n=1 Tax=Pseudomonas silesiensis TaxID=1853130 RepID=UPI0030D307E1
MDMGVKLSVSYPSVKAVEQATERLAATPGEDATEAVDKHEHDTEKVKSAVKAIEKFLGSTRRDLEFSMDEESGRIVVKVIASETGELIRQIPSEEALRIAHSLSNVNSLLFDAKV